MLFQRLENILLDCFIFAAKVHSIYIFSHLKKNVIRLLAHCEHSLIRFFAHLKAQTSTDSTLKLLLKAWLFYFKMF